MFVVINIYAAIKLDSDKGFIVYKRNYCNRSFIKYFWSKKLNGRYNLIIFLIVYALQEVYYLGSA